MTKRPSLKKLLKNTYQKKKKMKQSQKKGLKLKTNGRCHGKSKEILYKNINCI